MAHTQSIVNNLLSIGADIAFKDRLAMTLHDWSGLVPGYGMFIGTGLIIAFLTTAGLVMILKKKLHQPEHYLYPLAGACAVATILLSMQHLFGIVAIAGARGVIGFSFQLLAGLIGGWIFIKLISLFPQQKTQC